MRLLTAREILFDYLDDLLDTKDKRTVVALGKYLSKICKAEGISHVNSYTGNPNLYHVASVEKARQWIANGDVKFINEYLKKTNCNTRRYDYSPCQQDNHY